MKAREADALQRTSSTATSAAGRWRKRSCTEGCRAAGRPVCCGSRDDAAGQTGQTPMGGSPFHSPSGSERSLADLVAAPSGSSARGEKPLSGSIIKQRPAAASPSSAARSGLITRSRNHKGDGGFHKASHRRNRCRGLPCRRRLRANRCDLAAGRRSTPPPRRAPLAFLSTLHAKVGARLPGDMPAFAQSAIAKSSTTAQLALVNTTLSPWRGEGRLGDDEHARSRRPHRPAGRRPRLAVRRAARPAGAPAHVADLCTRPSPRACPRDARQRRVRRERDASARAAAVPLCACGGVRHP